MVEFFRDVLDGPLYIVTAVICVIFIMAIIGFLMERKKLEKEAKNRVAVINNNPVNTSSANTPVVNNQNVQQPEVTPINPVTVQEVVEVPNVQTEPTSTPNLIQEENTPAEVKKPVIVFEDPDEKTE